MAKIRARARAVDMLGRQQIAGIQNAVSELFKNAHDAYATLVRVDYLENLKLVLVRDNGVGMTRDDFEDKWLVLGTESKLGSGSAQHFRPPELEARPVTGEKGIGRLAIALLGRQVLVLTRAMREDGPHDLVAGLVHWGLFELPGLNLDEIEIPVATFKGGTMPTDLDIARLSGKLVKCLDSIAVAHPDLNIAGIRRDVTGFRPDPADLDEFMLPHDDGELSLANGGCGTQFIIGPATEILGMEIAAEDRIQDWSFRKHLIGFENNVFLAQPPPRIRTSFRHWRPGAIAGEELLNTSQFFSPEELQNADHFLEGAVDEFGQFTGRLRVYDKEYPELPVAWRDGAGKLTECGPFKVVFGYLMGNKSESRLDPETFDELNGKLNRLGGMYIFRDGIRVLPYGDHSVDWLEVEKRRNKGLAHYFFSFRRMFGAVLLTRNDNSNLEEKAGREGWQQNKAYRQLRDILINLLLNLAAEFFRKGGVNSELFEQQQTELKRKTALLEKREKQVASKKRKFMSELDRIVESMGSGLATAAVSAQRQQMQSAMQAAASLQDQDQAASALIRAERSAQEQIRGLREKFNCRKPAGVGLSKDTLQRWNAYLTERNRLDSELFDPFETEIAATLGAVAKRAKIYVNQRKRLEEGLQAVQAEHQKRLKRVAEEARTSANATRATVMEVTQKAIQSFDGVYRQIETDMGRTDFLLLEDEQVESLRKKWEQQLVDVEKRHRESLEAARDMLAALAANLQATDPQGRPELMDQELIEAIEERMGALEEQADEDFEMVQLGMAVAIINHEFGAAIRNVRRSIQELGYLARGKVTITPLYESIRSNFEHLDGHLNLFTPLQRRLHRKALRISGKRIVEYVMELFSQRLVRHEVELLPTEAFFACVLECYPSTIYPVFINLVDNAIHWLGTMPKSQNRIITMDAETDGLLVANNGPPIPDRDLSALFQRGFTRKQGGRGLGLFIAKKALQKEGMDISLETPPPGMSVAFRLSIPNLQLKP